MEAYQTEFINTAIQLNALKFGEFSLKSGRQSPYFFNMGAFASGESLDLLGQCYSQAILAAKLEFDVLFGPAYKGIPLACTTVIHLSRMLNKPIPYSFNRKEAKDHGEGGNIVGAPLSGDVLIIDDVITAGTAINEAIDIIKTNGATPKGVVIALDRQERGKSDKSAVQEIQDQHDVPVISIINLSTLRQYIESDNALIQYGDAIKAYAETYGISG